MKVLLYAPSLTGHPQVYCRVLGDILLDAGHRVIIAAGDTAADMPIRWRDFRPFAAHSGVRFVDTRVTAGGSAQLGAEALRALQDDCGADATLFVEGDHWRAEFARIAAGRAPRLRGRTIAIFGATCSWYPGEDPYTGRPPAATLRQRLGRLRRRWLHPRGTDAFFFERVLPRRRPLDVALVKDERVAERYGAPYVWMPEIYRVLQPRPTEHRQPDWDRWARPVSDFIARAGPANVLLYFGTGAWYKGYDLFLRLAELDPTTYALHAGAPDRREPGKDMRFDTDRIRADLLRVGRLFETNAFVDSDDLVNLLFGRIERFVSTHRLTLSSGTMLQALELGKPVLTPDSGLVGHRTRVHGLGMTYRYFDDRHLAEMWQVFRRTPVSVFQSAAAAFMTRFSHAALGRVLAEALEL